MKQNIWIPIVLLSLFSVNVHSKAPPCPNSGYEVQKRIDGANARLAELDRMIRGEGARQGSEWEADRKSATHLLGLQRMSSKILNDQTQLLERLTPQIEANGKVRSAIDEMDKTLKASIALAPGLKFSEQILQSLEAPASGLTPRTIRDLVRLSDLLADYEQNSLDWNLQQTQILSNLPLMTSSVIKAILDGLLKTVMAAKSHVAELKDSADTLALKKAAAEGEIERSNARIQAHQNEKRGLEASLPTLAAEILAVQNDPRTCASRERESVQRMRVSR